MPQQPIPDIDSPTAASTETAIESNHLISVRDIARYVWYWRRLILILIAGSAVVSFIVFRIMSAHYLASAYVRPATFTVSTAASPFQTGISLGSAGASALSSLLGTASAANTSPNFQSYLALLTSPRLCEDVEKKYHVMHLIFHDSWNSGTHSWYTYDDPFSTFVNDIGWLLRVRIFYQPTIDDFAKHLQKYLVINLDPTSNLYQITLEEKDQQTATMVLNALLTEAEQIVRKDQTASDQAAMKYIDKSLPTITSEDHRQALISLLIQVEQDMIILNSHSPYAAQIVQPAETSIIPVSLSPPVAALIVASIVALLTFTVLVLMAMVKLPAAERDTRPESVPVRSRQWGARRKWRQRAFAAVSRFLQPDRERTT